MAMGTSTAKMILKKIPFLAPVARRSYLRAIHLLSLSKWRRLEGSARIQLELGSGPKSGENGWTTVDMNGADLNYDLRRGIPLKDACVDAIYTSHMFEHIPY